MSVRNQQESLSDLRRNHCPIYARITVRNGQESVSGLLKNMQLSSLSDLATDGTDKDEANRKFALASNTVALVAPQNVISALMEFHDEVKFSNPNKSANKHDELLVKLLLQIRKDIGVSGRDDNKTFNFHLIGSAPKKV